MTKTSWTGSDDPNDLSGIAHFEYDADDGQTCTFDVRLPDFRTYTALVNWAKSMAFDSICYVSRQLRTLAKQIDGEADDLRL